VKTAFGWHVVRRDAIVQARVSHVLIAFQGADRSQAVRTKEEARARADEALARIGKGEDFAAVAREMSDDPSASAGGDIGLVAPGQMVPAFEDAVFALKAGEHSGVVETPYGFHVVRRVE
jgi:parvulin-like peptidyl-prolyl isomerase